MSYHTIFPDIHISEGMVLQRNFSNKLCGRTLENKLWVEYLGTRYQAEIKDETFTVSLPPTEANCYESEIVFYGLKNKVVIKNILIGDVILCAGQSNMARTILDHEEEGFEKKDYKRNNFLRLFTVKPEQYSNVVGTLPLCSAWQIAESITIRKFSAVGYFIGKEIFEKTQVPIGLICSATGGSVLCHWLSREAVKELQEKENVIPYEINSGEQRHLQTLGYNAMIAPLLNCGMCFVVWYQGETNGFQVVGKNHLLGAQTYEKELRTLIHSWRRDFKQAQLPFCIIGLPKYNNPKYDFASIRKIQKLIAQTETNVYFSESLQYGEPNNIHPVDKTQISLSAASQILKKINRNNNIEK